MVKSNGTESCVAFLREKAEKKEPFEKVLEEVKQAFEPDAVMSAMEEIHPESNSLQEVYRSMC